MAIDSPLIKGVAQPGLPAGSLGIWLFDSLMPNY
jgi:hypothetical protein